MGVRTRLGPTGFRLSGVAALGGGTVYFGRQITVHESRELLAQFVCRSCAHAQYATVVGLGVGSGHSAFFLFGDQVRANAQWSARQAARNNVVETLALATCPSCGFRDPVAWRRAKLRWYVAIGVAIALASFIALKTYARSTSVAISVFLCAPVAVALAVFWSNQRWRWTRIEDRVTFLSEEESRRIHEEDAKRELRQNELKAERQERRRARGRR